MSEVSKLTSKDDCWIAGYIEAVHWAKAISDSCYCFWSKKDYLPFLMGWAELRKALSLPLLRQTFRSVDWAELTWISLPLSKQKAWFGLVGDGRLL